MGKQFIQNDNRNAICYYCGTMDAQSDSSIEQQKKDAHEYAKEHNMNIIKEYEERAKDDRTELQLLLSEITELKPAYLILWKNDRLSRDKIDVVIMNKKIRDAGCEMVCVAETKPENEADNVLLEALYEGMAQHLINQHKEN